MSVVMECLAQGVLLTGVFPAVCGALGGGLVAMLKREVVVRQGYSRKELRG